MLNSVAQHCLLSLDRSLAGVSEDRGGDVSVDQESWNSCDQLSYKLEPESQSADFTWRRSSPWSWTHLDELQFQVLGHLVGLTDPEDVPDDVLRRVAQCPQLLHNLVGLVNVPIHAVSQHAFHHQGVGLVAHLKHILAVDVAEAGVGRLQVVQRLGRKTGSAKLGSTFEVSARL